VTALAFHPNGRHFASGSSDGILKVYDTQAYDAGDLRQGRPHIAHALCSFGTSVAVGMPASCVEHLVWSRSGVLIAACAQGKCTALRFRALS